ncbi:MAG: pyroglutamyl-peptidase I [Frankiales bacterium]|nr:pyroglutamyl-peptidase I [Frankiales bacterium]
MTRILLTGFEPFGGESTNPSLLAVQRVAAGPATPDVQIRIASLPVVFGDAIDVMTAAVDEHEPDIVICVGEAGGRVAVTPERFALNLDDAGFPDNAGRQPLDHTIVEAAPVAYRSTLPVTDLVQAMRAAGIPAAPSSSAGNYVCNNVFYGLMHLIATTRPQLVGGFVHVPYMHEQVLDRADARPSLSIATITEAIAISVTTTVRFRAAQRQG